MKNERTARLVAGVLLVAGLVAVSAGCGGPAESDDTMAPRSADEAEQLSCPSGEQAVTVTITTTEVVTIEEDDPRLNPTSAQYAPEWDTNNDRFDPMLAGWVGGVLYSDGYFDDPDDDVRWFDGHLTVEGICPSLDFGVQFRLLHKGPATINVRQTQSVPAANPLPYEFGADIPVDPVLTVREALSDVERLGAGELRLTVLLPGETYPPEGYDEGQDDFPGPGYWDLYGGSE